MAFVAGSLAGACGVVGVLVILAGLIHALNR